MCGHQKIPFCLDYNRSRCNKNQIAVISVTNAKRTYIWNGIVNILYLQGKTDK